MNDEQDSGPKSQIPGSNPQGSTSQSSDTDADQGTASFDLGVNAAEIAGETVSVIGEATGRFPASLAVERGERESTGLHAFMVGAGILITRIIGLSRQRVFPDYLGTGYAASALTAAARRP